MDTFLVLLPGTHFTNINSHESAIDIFERKEIYSTWSASHSINFDNRDAMRRIGYSRTPRERKLNYANSRSVCNICRLPKWQTCSTHTSTHTLFLENLYTYLHPYHILWICVNFWLRAKGGTRVIPITCQPRKEKFSNCKTFIKM